MRFFVSRIRTGEYEDWPDWLTKVDFSLLKQKLLALIVLISGVQLLKAFMSLEKLSDRELSWLTGIHLALVFSAIAFSIADWLPGRQGKRGGWRSPACDWRAGLPGLA